MAEEELLVTLNRGDTGGGAGFGFSLLGSNAAGGLRGHHVIYDIVENSQAARSGKVREKPIFTRLSLIIAGIIADRDGEREREQRWADRARDEVVLITGDFRVHVLREIDSYGVEWKMPM